MIRALNRIGAALACSLLAAGTCAGLAALLVPDTAPPKPMFAIAGIDTPASPSAAAVPIAERLSHASADHGATLAAQNCASCHTLVEGAPTTVGPNLFAVVGRAVAAQPGFAYSTALAALGGHWTPDRLDSWLTSPQAMAPGTLMGFAGLPDPSDRADLIAFLQKSAPPPGAQAGGDGDFEALVAKADPKAGGALASEQCGACHSFDQGGIATVGPNLFGVFGRGIAQGPDFTYSAALSSHGGTWTVATLNRWLAGPSRFAPGTKMGFGGIADPASRASVVAYLRTLHP